VVVLPLRFIYRPDVFDAIAISLLHIEGNCLSWSELYTSVKGILGRILSPRDFTRHLLKMIEEKRLCKEDQKTRGTKVYYSLSANSKNEYQLNLLGIDENAKRRRDLIQLIFLFEIFGTDYQINEEHINEFLSYIPGSRNDLVVEEIGDAPRGAPIVTFYKPVNRVEIWHVRFEKSEFHEAESFYQIKMPGISLEDLVNPKSNRHLSFRLPYDHNTFTEAEAKDAIDTLLKANILKPVMSFAGQIRYSIADDRLSTLIEKLGYLHIRKLGLIELNWGYQRPTVSELEQLESAYSKRIVDRIRNESYTRRQVIRRDKIHFPSISKYASGNMNDLDKEIVLLKEQYSDVLSKYGFNLGFIDSLCFNTEDYFLYAHGKKKRVRRVNM
jgi:hypothetical protein